MGKEREETLHKVVEMTSKHELCQKNKTKP